MAEPIYPKDYVHLRKAFSGKVGGKTRGLLDLDGGDASEFFYQHTILRDFQLPPEIITALQFVGSWTIRLMASEATDAKVTFEQSVEWGVNVQGMAGGVLAQWQPINAGKIKTRICDGEPVPVAIEAQNPPRVPSVAPQPGDPGVPSIFFVQSTSLRVKMPALPERATHFSLLATGGNSIPAAADFKVLDEDMQPGQERDISAPEVGETDSKRIWVLARAHGPSGTYDGAAIRDADTELAFASDPVTKISKLTQVKGYKGYLYATNPRATEYYETTAYDINRQNTEGNFNINIGTDWISPAYRCHIPDGALLKIISDYWVGRINANDIYYSISFKPAAKAGRGLCIAQDGRVGERWYFYVKDAKVRIAFTAHNGNFAASLEDAVVVEAAPTAMQAFRVGATLWFIYEAASKIHLTRSLDEGDNWKEPQVMLENMNLLGAEVSDDGGTIYLYLRSTSVRDGLDVPVETRIEQGTLCRALIHIEPDGKYKGGALEKVQGDVTDFGSNLTLKRIGQTFFLLAEQSNMIFVRRSTDELKTLQAIT